MALVYIEKVKTNQAAFAAKVIEISNKLGIDPNWLMVVMYNESGLNHKAVNPHGGATGLIQFMPGTATSLGTTVEALKAMSNVEQLDWVYKFFKPYTGRIKSGYDLYSINFFPIMLGKPDSWVIHSKKLSAATVAKFNPNSDFNKDGQITIAEWKQSMKKKFTKANVDPEKKN